MVESLYTYGRYTIEVGKSTSDASIEGDVYLVRNSETGVVEAETSSLFRAVMSARVSEVNLTRLLDMTEPTDDELFALESDYDSMGDPMGKKH